MQLRNMPDGLYKRAIFLTGSEDVAVAVFLFSFVEFEAEHVIVMRC